ncbi:MAG: MmgE/PrpD family protein [Deltaproteobacteria bacterium]|nr:MmgE/PrpD family protein [Deltaproteobacteria bacterium]MBW1931118.1 MmgE/PrpD family protein [Deltaproteobacteria bacterium]MBW2025505.1 MmgE/PrpD family protein [Deltaproteobacteria bacterium]MBW2125303.1 MmgE/PrpD family protein [Deltaproteobacteria bacterium]
MSSQDITRNFAEFVSETQFSDLPKEVVDQAKDYILDCIGCTMGSYAVPEGIQIAKLGKEFGSGTEATILANGHKTSAAAAAFVNCKLCNFIDADETLYNYYHIGGVPFFAALHAAEKVGASGKDLITAVVVGYEFSYRFCQSYALLTINEQGGTDIAKASGFGFNSIAAAVAAAKILGLDTESVQNAMGIAGYYTAVPLISKWLYTKPLGNLKYQDMGWFSFVGLISAFFSKDGYTSDPCIVDDIGEYSFWKAFGMLEFDFDAMVRGLGENWGIMEMGIKPYPCCRWFHTPIYMLKTIMKNEGLKPDDIDAITVKVHPAVAKSELFQSLSRWDDWEFKDAVHAQYSAGYILACAAYDIPIGPQWQLPTTLTNPQLVEFSKKVTSIKDEKCEQKMIAYLNSDQPKGKLMTQVHYTLEVVSNKGTFTDTAEYIYGDTYDPDHSLSRDELKEKFIGNSSAVLDAETMKRVIDATYEIDSFESINDFTALFE